jgi:DNA helicase-2/ATP-dependent DNA helicase PcrA
MTAKFLECLEDELNPQQLDAVTHAEGPMLVLAGAGSGKTRVLAYRLAYLLASGRCRPWEVLAVTFTNKAAEEMRARIASLIGRAADDVFMGTFHRTCATFLRRYGEEIGVPRNFDIADDTASLILVKRVMRHLDIDTKKEDPRSYQYSISSAKAGLLTPGQFEAQAFDNWSKKVAGVYSSYQKGLVNARSLDFDDLIMKAVQLLDAKGPASDELTDRFRYILVDEYQDINYAQYRFIRGLARKWGNLAVVGDDDQAIYGFRGADTSFILNFHRDFPSARVVKLERNYRSTGNILRCANVVAEKNDSRRRKKLWTDAEKGELIYHYMATNEEDEAHFCASIIEEFVKQGVADYRDCAVLYRTNAQSRSFEEAFSLREIPHQIIGGIRFYERKEIKDIISYLQVLNNPYASMALERVINNPTRGIGPMTYLSLVQVLTEEGMNMMELAGHEEGLAKLGKFRRTLEPFLKTMRSLYDIREELPVYALTVRLLEESGYHRRLKDADSLEAESRLENIGELLGSIKRYDEAYPTEGLPAFLEQVALISDVDRLERDDDSVKIMTCHSAKGLEFNVVFLTGLEEGLLPHSRSIHRHEDLEEERRLCYVGITRAKARLYLTWARRRRRFGGTSDQVPSRFLREIPEDVLHFESDDREEMLAASGVSAGGFARRSTRSLPGGIGFDDEMPVDSRARDAAPSAFNKQDRVYHPRFGNGVVVEVRDAGGGDHFLLIRFDDHGRRLLSENKAPLRRIE